MIRPKVTEAACSDPTALLPYHVLCLDGGGMRGLYTASLLQRLTAMFHRDNSGKPFDVDLGRSFNLICGTSTGAILAAALARKIPLSDVIRLYREHGQSIFPNPIPPDNASLWRRWTWCAKHRRRSAACASELQSVLEQWFHSETFYELYRERNVGLCIQAVDACTGMPKVFKTSHSPEKRDDDDVQVVDAIMASTAAPIYFPLHSIRRSAKSATVEYVDGGLWANNPVLVGLLEALTITEKERPIHILSAGTCSKPMFQLAGTRKRDRGLLDWKVGVDILDLSMQAQSHGAVFAAELLGEALRECGRDVAIYRIPQSAPSEEMIKHLCLDASSSASLDALQHLGELDAEAAYREVQCKGVKAKILRSTLGCAPALRIEERIVPA